MPVGPGSPGFCRSMTVYICTSDSQGFRRLPVRGCRKPFDFPRSVRRARTMAFYGSAVTAEILCVPVHAGALRYVLPRGVEWKTASPLHGSNRFALPGNRNTSRVAVMGTGSVVGYDAACCGIRPFDVLPGGTERVGNPGCGSGLHHQYFTNPNPG